MIMYTTYLRISVIRPRGKTPPLEFEGAGMGGAMWAGMGQRSGAICVIDARCQGNTSESGHIRSPKCGWVEMRTKWAWNELEMSSKWARNGLLWKSLLGLVSVNISAGTEIRAETIGFHCVSVELKWEPKLYVPLLIAVQLICWISAAPILTMKQIILVCLLAELNHNLILDVSNKIQHYCMFN
jgi:hypothetical protein